MRAFHAVAGAVLSIGAAVLFACSSDGSDGGGGPGVVDGPDAAGPGRDAGGPEPVLEASVPDACAAPDAGEGASCKKDEDCACNTVCAGLRCFRRSACNEALLSWDGPTTNVDGTCALDLAGFVVHYGQSQGGPYDEIDAGSPCVPGPMVSCGDAGQTVPQLACAYRVGPLDAGTWYFTVSAYTDAGVESALATPEVSKTVACP